MPCIMLRCPECNGLLRVQVTEIPEGDEAAALEALIAAIHHPPEGLA